MISERLTELEMFSRPAQPLVLMEHPLFSVMPSVVRSLISTEACQMTLVPGQEVPEDSLILVMKGLLGLFDAKTGAAGGVIGPRAGLAGSANASQASSTIGRAIVETQVYALPLSSLSQTCGTTWTLRFAAVHASSRARLMGVEQVCRQAHSPTERLAKWCLRLSPSLVESDLSLSPAILAELVGLSEAGFKETWGQLAADGNLPQHPGDFKALNLEGLKVRACCCDQSLHDGGIERRSRRRLPRRA